MREVKIIVFVALATFVMFILGHYSLMKMYLNALSVVNMENGECLNGLTGEKYKC